MKRPNRRVIIISLLALLGLILLFAAPSSNKINTGSTWGNEPSGYGAWYDYMQAQGVNIERWQRPIPELLEKIEDANEPATLLQVRSPDGSHSLASFENASALDDWTAQGNRLIVLTQLGPVTAADFSTDIVSDSGLVTVETRRRFQREDAAPSTSKQQVPSIATLLADNHGAVVWQILADNQGPKIYSSTPFIGANAYLNSPGNFAFLSELVQQSGGPIWVDEYLHGYKDSDVVIKETAGSWVSYLAKTPLLIAAVQGGVILLIGLIAQNRRVGARQTVPTFQVDNSEAYIKALAGVLHKANNHDFLVETLSRAERKSLQRALGLGDAPVPPDTLKTAWQQATGRSVADLSVLQERPRGDRTIETWLQRLWALQVRAARKESSSPEKTL